eukprot:1031084-Rhodomonas_salina.5
MHCRVRISASKLRYLSARHAMSRSDTESRAVRSEERAWVAPATAEHPPSSFVDLDLGYTHDGQCPVLTERVVISGSRAPWLILEGNNG